MANGVENYTSRYNDKYVINFAPLCLSRSVRNRNQNVLQRIKLKQELNTCLCFLLFFWLQMTNPFVCALTQQTKLWVFGHPSDQLAQLELLVLVFSRGTLQPRSSASAPSQPRPVPDKSFPGPLRLRPSPHLESGRLMTRGDFAKTKGFPIIPWLQCGNIDYNIVSNYPCRTFVKGLERLGQQTNL